MNARKQMKYSFLYMMIMSVALLFMFPAAIFMIYGENIFIKASGCVLNCVCGWVVVGSAINTGKN